MKFSVYPTTMPGTESGKITLEYLKVRRAFDLRRLLDFARDRRHEAAQDQDLRWHAIDAVDDDQADPVSSRCNAAQRIVERDQHGLLRQHQAGQQQRKDVSSCPEFRTG